MVRMSKRSNVSVKELSEIASQHYDISRIKISSVERRAGPNGVEFAVPFELPSKVATEPSLFARIIIRLKGAIPEGIAMRIQEAVQNVLTKFGGGDATLIDLQRAIKTLKKKFRRCPSMSSSAFRARPATSPLFRQTRFVPVNPMAFDVVAPVIASCSSEFR